MRTFGAAIVLTARVCVWVSVSTFMSFDLLIFDLLVTFARAKVVLVVIFSYLLTLFALVLPATSVC